MTRRGSPSRDDDGVKPDDSTPVTIAGVAAHLVVCFLCAMALIDAAYAYPGVSSWDELRRVGSAPRLGFLALQVTFVVALLAAVGLLASSPRLRGRAWCAPAAGIGVSVIVTAIAIAFYQEPEPIIGG